jgi:hypothetical protein
MSVWYAKDSVQVLGPSFVVPGRPWSLAVHGPWSSVVPGPWFYLFRLRVRRIERTKDHRTWNDQGRGRVRAKARGPRASIRPPFDDRRPLDRTSRRHTHSGRRPRLGRAYSSHRSPSSFNAARSARNRPGPSLRDHSTSTCSTMRRIAAINAHPRSVSLTMRAR